MSVSPAMMPEVLALANDSLPGLALAYSISSLTDFDGQARICHEHEGKTSNTRYCREVLHGIVAHVLHQEWNGGKRGVGRHQQRVAKPLTINMGFGIRPRATTPLLSAAQLQALGVAVVIYPGCSRQPLFRA
jgi:hypothetical protein